jgi:hypothetical protein
MSHLSEEVWIAVLTGTAGPEEPRAAAGHASCAECAPLRRRLEEEQSAFRTALASAPVRRRPGSMVPALAVAALLLASLIFILLPPMRTATPAARTPYRGLVGTLDGLRLRSDDGKDHELAIDPARSPQAIPSYGRVFVRAIVEKDRLVLLDALVLTPGNRIEWEAGPATEKGTRRYGLVLLEHGKPLPGVWPLGVIPEDGRFTADVPGVNRLLDFKDVSLYAWLDSNDNGFADEPDRLLCLPSSVSSPLKEKK